MKLNIVDHITLVIVFFVFMLTKHYFLNNSDIDSGNIYLISVYHSFLVGLLFEMIANPIYKSFRSNRRGSGDNDCR